MEEIQAHAGQTLEDILWLWDPFQPDALVRGASLFTEFFAC